MTGIYFNRREKHNYTFVLFFGPPTGDSAFRGCSSLTQITILTSITSIKGYTFERCSSLTRITIPSFVTSIANYAFSGCSSLTQITIPSSVTSIRNYAFTQKKFYIKSYWKNRINEILFIKINIWIYKLIE